LQHYLNPEREVQRLKKTEERRYELHRVSSHKVPKNPAGPLGIGKQHNQHIQYAWVMKKVSQDDRLLPKMQGIQKQ